MERQVSLAISVTALALSLSVFLHGRWRDKRDLLLKLHEQLVSAEKQAGRRLLYEMAERQLNVEDLSQDEHLAINNTLAAFNLLGIYYQRRYIRRADALELWAVPIVRAVPAAKTFLAHRDAQKGTEIFPQLRAMQHDAEQYLRRRQIQVRMPGPLTPPTRPSQ